MIIGPKGVDPDPIDMAAVRLQRAECVEMGLRARNFLIINVSPVYHPSHFLRLFPMAS